MSLGHNENFFFLVKIWFSAPALLCRCSRWSCSLFVSMNNGKYIERCMNWVVPIVCE